MYTHTQTNTWDLTPVFDLVNSLSTENTPKCESPNGLQTPTRSTADGTASPSLKIERRDFATSSSTPSGLGDFAKVWQFLGVDSPSADQTQSPGFTNKADYASDGATYFKSPGKGSKAVKFHDNTSGDDVGEETVTDGSASPTLTKTQRKKRNRKLRKADEAAKAASDAIKSAVVSESEAEITIRRTPTPARRAGAHIVPSESPRPRNDGATPTLEETLAMARARVAQELQKNQKKSAKHAQFSTPQKSNGYMSDTLASWSTNNTKRAASLLPSTVQPRRTSTASRPQILQQSFTQTPTKSKYAIEPKIIRTGEDKDFALFMKLLNNFSEDRRALTAPMNLTTHNNHASGIHVFVDASNIFIGFTDQLKQSRGIPATQHVPQVGLSFDGLALLMERRRPVAKRVLAGSTPHIAAFDKAEDVGYECSILEKVYKARELTERQIYFRDIDNGIAASTFAKASAAKGSSGSGSETNAPQYAPARMIEQGVDEILHLKILESIVDTDVPSTIVLATGDAAQAEYSQGFMAMVERALKKGWKVELVSWSKNISMMYKRKEWVRAWGDQFKVIYLDDYAEELLDM